MDAGAAWRMATATHDSAAAACKQWQLLPSPQPAACCSGRCYLWRQQVRGYLSSPAATLVQERHIPTRLQTKVRRYLTQVWAPHAGIDDAEQFEALPVELR